MGHGRRVGAQGFHAPEALGATEQADCGTETSCCSLAAVDSNCDHASEEPHLSLRYGVAAVVIQAGIDHLANLFPSRKFFCNPLRVRAVFFHSDSQGLHSAVRQVAVHWTGHAADGVLQESNRRQEIGFSGDYGAADHIRVPADVFSGAMHDEVGAQPNRLLEVRSGERVVDDRESAMRMSGVDHPRDVHDLQ